MYINKNKWLCWVEELKTINVLSKAVYQNCCSVDNSFDNFFFVMELWAAGQKQQHLFV